VSACLPLQSIPPEQTKVEQSDAGQATAGSSDSAAHSVRKGPGNLGAGRGIAATNDAATDADEAATDEAATDADEAATDEAATDEATTDEATTDEATTDQTTANNVTASGMAFDDVLPVDARIRTGQLENGLTYYIRQNQQPENRAELRLAVNAGSLQEDDDQLGVAHFLEHMLFNGTEQFEGDEIVRFLEGIGMSFGPDLNAYTTYDETVYVLKVPTDDDEIDGCCCGW